MRRRTRWWDIRAYDIELYRTSKLRLDVSRHRTPDVSITLVRGPFFHLVIWRWLSSVV